MNLTDVETIIFRLKAAQYRLGKLHTLNFVHQARKVIIVDQDLPLTPGQLNSIKGFFNSDATRLKLAIDKLVPLTGKAGTAETDQVQQVQANPALVFNALQDLIELTGGLIEHTPPSAIDAAGDYAIPDLDDAVAQQTADALETFVVAGKWWIDQEAAKL